MDNYIPRLKNLNTEIVENQLHLLKSVEYKQWHWPIQLYAILVCTKTQLVCIHHCGQLIKYKTLGEQLELLLYN